MSTIVTIGTINAHASKSKNELFLLSPDLFFEAYSVGKQVYFNFFVRSVQKPLFSQADFVYTKMNKINTVISAACYIF
ncbi:hypothetical protein SAMN05216436_10824 [bacterium A37T11]|nr:hypothetical protein SAMN05216436_10824 [bacterium A37T11]